MWAKMCVFTRVFFKIDIKVDYRNFIWAGSDPEQVVKNLDPDSDQAEMF
jgi:hypothetical protein